MKIRPVGAELFHADGQMGGQTDRQTDRHDDFNNVFSQKLRKATKISSLKTCRISYEDTSLKATKHCLNNRMYVPHYELLPLN